MKTYSCIFLSLFLIFSASAMAQNDKTAGNKTGHNKFDTVASSAVVRLQQKILLSDKQTSELTSVVSKYIKVKENLDNSSKLFSQMLPLMDARQKIKFEIIRNDWWTNLVGELKK